MDAKLRKELENVFSIPLEDSLITECKLSLAFADLSLTLCRYLHLQHLPHLTRGSQVQARGSQLQSLQHQRHNCTHYIGYSKLV